jgi:hypothetical protein
MASAKAWLERANWSNRSKRFGKLGLALGHGDLAIVTMELDAPIEGMIRFWEAWRSLPSHPALLQALAAGVLRYAAIDWRPAKLDPGYNQVHIARYGVVLCDLLDAIRGHLGTSTATWFVRPIVKLDLQHMLRVAFVPPTHDDRARVGAFVRAVGLGLEQLITVASEAVELGRIIRRCIDLDHKNAFRSLDDVRKVLGELDRSPLQHGSRLPFEAIEQGIGAYWHRKPILGRLWINRPSRFRHRRSLAVFSH